MPLVSSSFLCGKTWLIWKIAHKFHIFWFGMFNRMQPSGLFKYHVGSSWSIDGWIMSLKYLMTFWCLTSLHIHVGLSSQVLLITCRLPFILCIFIQFEFTICVVITCRLPFILCIFIQFKFVIWVVSPSSLVTFEMILQVTIAVPLKVVPIYLDPVDQNNHMTAIWITQILPQWAKMLWLHHLALTILKVWWLLLSLPFQVMTMPLLQVHPSSSKLRPSIHPLISLALLSTCATGYLILVPHGTWPHVLPTLMTWKKALIWVLKWPMATLFDAPHKAMSKLKW